MSSFLTSIFNRFFYSCKEASALLVMQEDKPLGFLKNVRILAHLKMCTSCQRFLGQMLTMRNHLKAWRHYHSDYNED